MVASTVCVDPCIVNHHNETKCVLLFLAVKSEPDVDLAPEVDRRDDTVKKKPILERTCESISCHGFRVTSLGSSCANKNTALSLQYYLNICSENSTTNTLIHNLYYSCFAGLLCRLEMP